MKVRVSIYSFAAALGLVLAPIAELIACEITMGYRTSVRSPLIEAAPDNSGLYQELFSRAASKAGCELVIVRAPKKRILNDLANGKIDFYPGFNFNLKRAEYAYYMVNGLPGGDIGISHQGIDSVTDIGQLKGKILLIALGGPEHGASAKGVVVRRPSELNLERAVGLIAEKKGDFYIYNRSSLEYYLKQNPNPEIRKHYDCCGGEQPMYLGFSQKSANMAAVPNAEYNADADLSPTNFPVRPGDGSVAQRFSAALEEMRQSGETQKIYDMYYK